MDDIFAHVFILQIKHTDSMGRRKRVSNEEGDDDDRGHKQRKVCSGKRFCFVLFLHYLFPQRYVSILLVLTTQVIGGYYFCSPRFGFDVVHGLE